MFNVNTFTILLSVQDCFPFFVLINCISTFVMMTEGMLVKIARLKSRPGGWREIMWWDVNSKENHILVLERMQWFVERDHLPKEKSRRMRRNVFLFVEPNPGSASLVQMSYSKSCSKWSSSPFRKWNRRLLKTLNEIKPNENKSMFENCWLFYESIHDMGVYTCLTAKKNMHTNTYRCSVSL